MNWIKLSEKLPLVGEKLWLKLKIKGEPPIQKGERLRDCKNGITPWFHTDLGIWCGPESVTHWCEIEEPKE